DAGLSLRYDRIEKSHDIDTLIKQASGKLLGQLGVVEHDRHDWVTTRFNIETCVSNCLTEPHGVAFQFIAQRRCLRQDVEHLDRRADNSWCKGIGEKVRA